MREDTARECAGSTTTAAAVQRPLRRDEDGIEEPPPSTKLLRELLRGTQHLIELRNEGVIGDEAMHRIERDLDLEESRLEA